MTQQEQAALVKRINDKCDGLALDFFEKSDDLAAVAFQLREVIVQRLAFAEKREARNGHD